MLRYPELQESWTQERDQGGDRLSVQQHMEENPYVQGCNGGYPYLVAKWGVDNDLHTEQCFSGSSDNSMMSEAEGSTAAPGSCGARYRVTNFRYVGGAYGRCGMHHLCEEAIR